jgi:hypothetical protein
MVGEPTKLDDLPATTDSGFLRTGLFEPVAVRQYPGMQTYDTETYIKLLQTFSDHIALPAPTRHALLTDIAALIDEEFGGRVVKHVVSVLQLVRRR